MDAQVPAVVAVIVTADPGPWFDEGLRSLAAQDYSELSVLVLSSGDDGEGVIERVGRVLPEAFIRHVAGRPCYPCLPMSRRRWALLPFVFLCFTAVQRLVRLRLFRFFGHNNLLRSMATAGVATTILTDLL